MASNQAHNPLLGQATNSAVTLDRALGTIKSEWRRFELERAEWDIERVRLKAQLRASEKRIELLTSQYQASQRQLNILESILSENKRKSDGRPLSMALSELSASNSGGANGGVSGSGSAGTVSDLVDASATNRDRSKDLLRRCLGEIDILLGKSSSSAFPADVLASAATLAKSAVQSGSADINVPSSIIESEVTNPAPLWQMPALVSTASSVAAVALGRNVRPQLGESTVAGKRRRTSKVLLQDRSESVIAAAAAAEPTEDSGKIGASGSASSGSGADIHFVGPDDSAAPSSPLIAQPEQSEQPFKPDTFNAAEAATDAAAGSNETRRAHDDTSEMVDRILNIKISDEEEHVVDKATHNVMTQSLTVDEIDIGDSTVKQVDASDWQMHKTFVGHLDTVRSISVRADHGSDGPDGGPLPQLLSGSDDGLVILWDIERSSRRKSRRRQAHDVLPGHIYRGHLAAVTSVVFAESHDFAYSGSLDSSIKVWQLPDDLHKSEGGDPEASFPAGQFIGHTDGVWDLALSTTAGLLASVSADATCKVWSVDPKHSGAPLRKSLVARWRASEIIVPTSTCFATADGTRLAVGYANGQIEIYDLNSGSSVLTIADSGERIPRITKIACRAGLAENIVAAACVDGSAHLFDMRSGRPAVAFGRPIGSSHTLLGAEATMAVDLVPDSASALVTGGSKGVVKWWDWRNAQTSVAEIARHRVKGGEGVCCVQVVGSVSSRAQVASAGADGLVYLHNKS